MYPVDFSLSLPTRRVCKGNTEKYRKTILKVDDLPIFMMFEKHNKTYRNVAVRTDAYVT